MIELHYHSDGEIFYLNPQRIERFFTYKVLGCTTIILTHNHYELQVQEEPKQILQAIREARTTGVLV